MEDIIKTSVVFTITMEDLIAFQVFNYLHVTTMRKSRHRFVTHISFCIFIIVLCSIFLLKVMAFWPALFTASATSAGAAGYLLYFYKYRYVKLLRKLTQRIYTDHKYPGLLGEHTLEVDEHGITFVSAFSRTQYSWEAMDKIESEAGHTYLYLGAQIIPVRHDSIFSGDFKIFLENISRYHRLNPAITR